MIGTESIEAVKETFQKFLKKAEKFGLGSNFSLSFEDKRIFTVYPDDLSIDEKKYYEVIDAVMVYETLKYKDWDFVGTISNDNHSINVILKNPIMDDVTIPDRFYTNDAQLCEHCNISRYRKETFIVHNFVTNEFKQVGRSCLKEFMGIEITSVMNVYDKFLELEKQIRSLLYDEDREVSFRNNAAEQFSVQNIMQRAVAMFRLHGYVSSKEQQQEGGGMSNKSKIISDINNTNPEYFFVKPHELTDEIAIEATNILNYFKDEFIKNPSAYSSDFWKNVNTIINDDFLTYREIGFIACLPVMYTKSLASKIKGEKSAFVGNIGDKLNMQITYKRSYFVETAYGAMEIVNMQDSKGNIIVWKTSTNHSMEVDKSYNVKFTVKDQTTYKDIKQTIVTRLKVV